MDTWNAPMVQSRQPLAYRLMERIVLRGPRWHGSCWQRGIAESGSSGLSTLMIDIPGDLVWYLPCMQQASYLEGVPLMWMLPLYLHVNQKSDDADDDEQHHWYIVKMLNLIQQCPPQHCFWHLYKNQSGTAWTMYHHRIIWFMINVQVQGQHPLPLPGSWLAARMADLIQDLQVCLSWELPLSAIPLRHLLSCHPGPPRLMLSINLYVKGSLDCSIGAFHISIPAEPFLLQNEVQILNANLHK